jgi:hypothetical protein
MKKLIICLTALLLTGVAFGQKINYQKSFDEALAKAKAEKKLLLVIITAHKPDITGHPELAHAFDTALDNPEVVNLYNKNFVNYTVSIADSAATALRTRYQPPIYPAFLFIDARGNLVYRDGGNSRSNDKYLNMSKNALAARVSGKTMSDYEDKYNHGDRTFTFLKEYITMRQELGFFNNANLIEEYVDQLPPNSYRDYNVVLFILKAGPLAYGKAYHYCYTERKVVDSIYKKEPKPLLSEINRRIPDNTAIEAINRKDVNLAQQGANFIATIWQRSDARKGQIYSQGRMLSYYQGVNDTANYYRRALMFYDNYYMNVSADSAKKVDQINRDNRNKTLLAQHKPDTVKTYVKGPDSVKRLVTRITRVIQSPIGDSPSIIASVLNNVAYTFYTSGTRNQAYIFRAVAWSKRSIELNPTFSSYDTLAHLLYRLGFFDEALSAQNKAVSLAEAKKVEDKELYKLKTEAEKIKTHQI